MSWWMQRATVKITDYSISKRLADICKEDVFEQTRVRFSDSALPYKTGKKGYFMPRFCCSPSAKDKSVKSIPWPSLVTYQLIFKIF